MTPIKAINHQLLHSVTGGFAGDYSPSVRTVTCRNAEARADDGVMTSLEKGYDRLVWRCK